MEDIMSEMINKQNDSNNIDNENEKDIDKDMKKDIDKDIKKDINIQNKDLSDDNSKIEVESVSLEVINTEDIEENSFEIDKDITIPLDSNDESNIFKITTEEEGEEELVVVGGGEDIKKEKEHKLAIYYHPKCMLHKIPDHPEQPARTDSILKQLKSEYNENQFRLAPLATDEQILLFHTQSLLDQFKKLSSTAESRKNMASNKKYVKIDSDTVVMWATREASYHAVGAMTHAIDCIYLPKEDPLHIETAFCCTRPPGHHAERNKSCGFCFFNNAGSY
jgi:hypothetical protein